jgi:hypothetical protein
MVKKTQEAVQKLYIAILEVPLIVEVWTDLIEDPEMKVVEFKLREVQEQA